MKTLLILLYFNSNDWLIVSFNANIIYIFLKLSYVKILHTLFVQISKSHWHLSLEKITNYKSCSYYFYLLLLF